MDYASHYGRLIDRARSRVLTGYSERHHVMPRCMGGGDDPSNIVRLTGEEHFVAHQLLVKMHPGNHRLMWALSAMTGSPPQTDRPKNKTFGWLRRRFADMVRQRTTGIKRTPEAKARMSASAKARAKRPHTEESKAKMSAACKGRAKSPQHRAAISAAMVGVKRGPYGPRSKEA